MLISETGDYITRNGTRVTIDKIDNKEKATANCKGQVWRLFRGKVRPKGYDIWCDNGAYRFIGEHGLDIIGKWGN